MAIVAVMHIRYSGEPARQTSADLLAPLHLPAPWLRASGHLQDAVIAAQRVISSGDRSCRENRLDHGLLLYRAVINRFHGNEFQLQSLSVQALLRSGAALTRLGRLQEAADANQAIFKYGEGAVAALDAYAVWYEKQGNQERLAWALMAKAIAIGALQRRDQTVTALNEVIARFQNDTSPVIQAIVAKAQEGLNEGASADG